MNKSLRSFVFFSGSGCLLPTLIIFNLFFGWVFLRPLYWLLTEAILILFLIINGYMITRKIFSASRKRDDVIDVKGEILDKEVPRRPSSLRY